MVVTSRTDRTVPHSKTAEHRRPRGWELWADTGSNDKSGTLGGKGCGRPSMAAGQRSAAESLYS